MRGGLGAGARLSLVAGWERPDSAAGEADDPHGLALPTSRTNLLTTDDIDQIRAEMTRAISEHVARPTGRATRIFASKAEAAIGDIGLIQLSYGAEVTITSESCAPYLLVQTPLSGRAVIHSAAQTVESGPAMGTIINPDASLAFDFSRELQLLLLRLPADRLERHCAQLLGERGGGLDRPLEFELGFSLAGEPGQRWLRLLKYFRDEAVGGESSLLQSSPLALAPFEQLLMNTLLSIQPHNHSDALLRRPSAAAPFYIRRAEDYIRAHAHEPLTLTEIAANSGISPRALHRGFQEFRGVSPMAQLKAVRLQRVRDELLASTPAETSVTDVALKWGFAHLGHFGQDYRSRFGETPAQTLRRFR
jgi:AraC-like DNA-binding protein